MDKMSYLNMVHKILTITNAWLEDQQNRLFQVQQDDLTHYTTIAARRSSIFYYCKSAGFNTEKSDGVIIMLI